MTARGRDSGRIAVSTLVPSPATPTSTQENLPRLGIRLVSCFGCTGRQDCRRDGQDGARR